MYLSLGMDLTSSSNTTYNSYASRSEYNNLRPAQRIRGFRAGLRTLFVCFGLIILHSLDLE
jgi:hypothetical protein